jgi:LemA protein
MQDDGILTPRQAAMLRDSLASGGTAADGNGTTRRRIWNPIWIAVAVIAVVGIALLALSGGAGVDGNGIQDVTRSLNQPGGHGEMSKPLSTILAIVVLLVVPLLLWVWQYNALVAKEEHVFEAWAQTESNFQRRADLIPALLDTVSRYLKHESETLTSVTQQRSQAFAGLTKTVDDLAEAQKAAADLLRQHGRDVIEKDAVLAELYAAQARIQRGMTAVLGVAESYPDLRSSDQFLALQSQIEGTENRINVARMRFNQAVRAYNKSTRQLPGVLVAQTGNFRRKAYFQSDEEARNAPDIKFK